MTDVIFLVSKITADGNCSHEIKRRLLLGRKVIHSGCEGELGIGGQAVEVGPHLPAYYTGVTSQGSQCTCVSASLLIGFGPATNLGGLLMPLQRFCRLTNVLRCSGPSQVWAMARATWRVRREEGRSAPGPPWIFFGVSPSILLLGKSHGQRSLVGCSPWGREESGMTEQLHFDFSLSCIGEGNGNPLRVLAWRIPGTGACWAAVYGVAQSRTRLK